VTSAAFFAGFGPALDTTAQGISSSFDTNFKANLDLVHRFLDTKHAPASGEERQEKTVLDVSSSTVHLLQPRNSAYAASKIAFSRFLCSVQVEHDEAAAKPEASLGYRLRAHSFHPGMVCSPAVKSFGFDENTLPWDDARLSGDFAVWLASPDAEFLKGRIVWANWDVRELVERKDEILGEDLLRLGIVGRSENVIPMFG